MAKVVDFQSIKSVDKCRYDAVSLGEVMLRLDPRDVPTARVRDNIRVSQGGGETNVACGLAYTFGLRTAVLTALVSDPIGENIRNQMREAGVDTGKIIWWNTNSDGTSIPQTGRELSAMGSTLHTTAAAFCLPTRPITAATPLHGCLNRATLTLTRYSAKRASASSIPAESLLL